MKTIITKNEIGKQHTKTDKYVQRADLTLAWYLRSTYPLRGLKFI